MIRSGERESSLNGYELPFPATEYRKRTSACQEIPDRLTQISDERSLPAVQPFRSGKGAAPGPPRPLFIPFPDRFAGESNTAQQATKHQRSSRLSGIKFLSQSQKSSFA